MGQQQSTPKVTAQDRAIFQLKQQRDKLTQYQQKLQTLSDKQNSLAKEAITQNKLDKAKFYLKLKKQQQSTIIQAYSQLNNLESLISTIEYKLVEKDVIQGLSQGNKLLTSLNNEISLDKVDQLLSDIQDETIKVDEISNALTSLNNLEQFEVDEEFEALQKEVASATETSPAINLPDAPKVILPDAPKSELPDNIEVPNEERQSQQIAN